jgi:hypothetical protein
MLHLPLTKTPKVKDGSIVAESMKYMQKFVVELTINYERLCKLKYMKAGWSREKMEAT